MGPENFEDMPAGTFKLDPSFKSLNIGVIGAGIAGLHAAIGLSHSGHRVEIFERSKFANETGSAIGICPNASRILKHWGFDFDRSKCVLSQDMRFVNGDTTELLAPPFASDLVEGYGAPLYYAHRADLHEELRRLVLAPGLNSEPTKLNLSAEVVDVECETGVITLVDGLKYQKDLIIVADGVHSRAVEKVTGMSTPTVPSGKSAFRFLIPKEKLLASSRLQPIFSGLPSSFVIVLKDARKLYWYPVRNGQLFSFSAVHPDRTSDQKYKEWNAAAPPGDLLETFKGFNPVYEEICGMAEDVKLWQMMSRKPIESWFNGKVVLIGDAAHAMLPYHGQGGAQAIEDGAALAVLLSNFSDSEDLGVRLQLFEDLRRPRASIIQVLSGAEIDQPDVIAQALQKYLDWSVPMTAADLQDLHFKYDVLRESRDVLSRHLQAKVQPNDE